MATTAAAGLLPSESRGAVRPRSTGRPKNVLILMADQHNPNALGVAGNPVAKTPHLDALARSGLRFEYAYCTDPICVASRASLLTSLYVHNHKAYNNSRTWPFDKRSMAYYFGSAGYMTAMIGKMHFVDAQRHGFDYNIDFNEWFQYLGPKTKIYADELSAPDDGSGQPQVESEWKEEKDPWAKVKISENNEAELALATWMPARTPDGRKGYNHPGRVSLLPEADHFESFVSRESIRFLQQYGNSHQPFLLIASFLKPHNPFMPAERFYRMFKALDMRLPDTWGKVDRAKVPAYIRYDLDHPSACPELADPKWAKVRLACYYASLAQVDYNVGLVLKSLRELGLENDTIVIYTSDHGDMLGAHGLWQKFVFYEPSVRIPLIFRVPELTSQNVINQTPVSLVQVLPSLLELCGISMPVGLDGRSLVPSLRSPEMKLDTTIFAENSLGSRSAGYMIREGHFKYCYCPNDMPELYNLAVDPDEMDNLALKPEYKSRVRKMQAELFAWHRPTADEAPDLPMPHGNR